MSKRKARDQQTSILLLLPLGVWLLCFAVIPLAYGFWLSFFDARMVNLSNPAWVGLNNYITIFKSYQFRFSLFWSLRFAIISVSIEMVLGMLIVQLFRKNFWGRNLAITLFMLPMVISPVLMGTMFRLLFDQAIGPLSYLLSGLTGTTAILGMNWINSTIITADTINMTPMVFLNVYTASNGVSGDLTEAAKVDGANAWQTLIYVIYPVIMPILLITFLERILAGFLMFSLVFALTGGGPGIFTQSASIFIWNTAFASGDFGVANAASYILALLLLFPALYLVRRMMRTIL